MAQPRVVSEGGRYHGSERLPPLGVDVSENQVEYPFQTLLREHNPAVRFVHTGVQNQSARYYKRPRPNPCVVCCPDCAGHEKKLALCEGWDSRSLFAVFCSGLHEAAGPLANGVPSGTGSRAGSQPRPLGSGLSSSYAIQRS
jgi:hypothetical protein